MKSKKLMSKVITAVVAGSVLLSTGSYVFAKSNTDGTTGVNAKRQEAIMNKKASVEDMKIELDKLVTAGTITQDEENKIFDFMNQKETERKAKMDKVKNMTEAERKTYFENNKKERTDLTAELVTAGIMSQEKADAIKAAMPAPKDHGPVHK